MKVYTINHPGHYLGGASVVVAESPEEACARLQTELAKRGIRPQGMETPVEIDLTQAAVHVLFDGDYGDY